MVKKNKPNFKVNFGKGSYCHNYNEVGDLDKSTNIGNYTSINEICIVGWASYGHDVSKISNYPFGWHAPHLTDPEKFKDKSRVKVLNMKKVTNIGSDVWIGSGVSIKCGVTIGDGAVVGYNSNVTKDVPPYCVVAGNPAKFIKKRYSDEIIDELIKIKWWNWPEEKIKENQELFLNGSIDEFVDKHKIK